MYKTPMKRVKQFFEEEVVEIWAVNPTCCSVEIEICQHVVGEMFGFMTLHIWRFLVASTQILGFYLMSNFSQDELHWFFQCPSHLCHRFTSSASCCSTVAALGHFAVPDTCWEPCVGVHRDQGWPCLTSSAAWAEICRKITSKLNS